MCSKVTWDTTNIRIKYKLPKKGVTWVYVIEILKKKAIVRIKKTIAIFKRPVNKLFPIEYTYHDTNQTDKAREQKLRWEAAVIGELKRKYEC